MAAPAPKPIVNIDEASLVASTHGVGFSAQLARLGGLIGARKLGCQLHLVPAGKKAFPRHAHHANEEMFFILAGQGTYHVGEQSHPIRAGDVISAPAGDSSTAHQIVNNSAGELRYLAFSTRLYPEVVEYPDSGKFSVSSSASDDAGRQAGRIYHMARPGTSLDYWDGEK